MSDRPDGLDIGFSIGGRRVDQLTDDELHEAYDPSVVPDIMLAEILREQASRRLSRAMDAAEAGTRSTT